MARQTVFDDSSDDEFPEIQALGVRNERRSQLEVASTQASQSVSGEGSPVKSTIRRRKLAQITDNALLRPWSEHGRPAGEDKPALKENEQSKPRVQLRKRVERQIVREIEVTDQSSGEDFSINGFSEDDSSAFHTALESELDEDDSFTQVHSVKSPEKSLLRGKGKTVPAFKSLQPGKEPHIIQRSNRAPPRSHTKPPSKPLKGVLEGRRKQSSSQKDCALETRQLKPVQQQSSENSLTGAFSKLQTEFEDPRAGQHPTKDRPVTPPATPPKARAGGLVSPRKLSRIPMTPHRPSTDTFWNQEFVDEWNDEHSPKKTLWLPEVNKSPLKKSPSKKASADRAARKVFERAKHVLAADFLQELDQIVTNGQLQKLADSTGGIKIQWTNKLNTTAGRANWKRETIKTKPSTGDEVVTKHRHHASIELAEKVIDDEHRLLNVIAHEFCHLANFMISGVTANPHGKEFKAWASKCSRSFGHRGIEVTTKHTYDIDFKYIWECADCSMEFKRHSKSINPERHRCGCCKGELKQTKPVPRATAKASEYQNFMRAQMKIVKEQNPTSPQKDILRIVADKWSRKDKLHIDNDQDAKINSVADVLDQLTLEDKH